MEAAFSIGIHICWSPFLGIERRVGRDEGGLPNAEMVFEVDSMPGCDVREA